MTRWQGPFETPNIAALAAASVAMVVIALGVVWWRQRRFAYASAAGCAVITCVALIAATGSRAGAAELVAGLIVLGLRRAIPPWPGIMLALILAAFAWIFPLGIRTAASIGDASITHRLDLWHATMMLIGDHPWVGVGPDRCMAALDEWYLPPDLRGRFYSPINSALALAAYFGVGAVGAATVAVALLVCFLTSSSTRGAMLPALAVALLTIHGIGCLFQGHWYFRTWWWIAAPSAMIVLLAVVHAARMTEQHWKRWCCISLGCGVGAAMIVTISAQVIAKRHPLCTRWCGETLVGQRRHIPAAETIVILANAGIRPNRGLEVRLRDSIVAANFASAVITDDRRLSATPATVMVLHQRAADLLRAPATDPLKSHTLVLVDPWIDDEPSSAISAIVAPSVMVLTRSAPFVDAARCRRWAEAHHLRVIVLPRLGDIGSIVTSAL